MSLNGVSNGKAQNSRGSKGGKAKGEQQNTTNKEGSLRDLYKFDNECNNKSTFLEDHGC